VNFAVASSSVDEGMAGLQALESSFHGLMLFMLLHCCCCSTQRCRAAQTWAHIFYL